MAAFLHRTDPGGWQLRWSPELAARYRSSGDWVDRTVAELASERVQRQPDRLLLVEADRAFTATQLYDKALRLAGWFTSIGLNRGEVVSFQLPNWWEASVIDLAACMCGLVINPLGAINREAEVGHILSESRSRVIFVPGVFRKQDYVSMMRTVLAGGPTRPRVVVVRDDGHEFDALEQILAEAPPLAAPLAVDPDTVKLLMYTSGTTGRPKGVLHSHNTILADCVKMKAVLELTEGDSVFCGSPLTHVTGYLWLILMPWYGGLRGVTLDTWDAARGFDLLEAQRCSVMLGATPFLSGLLEVVRERGRSLPSLRHYVCGGASVPPSLIYDAAERLPNCIPWRTFGATEAPTMTCGPRSRDDIRLGAETDGRLYRCEVRIVDLASGQPLPPGHEGEILVREPSMALGYARAEDNVPAYDEDGYFRMGDLGRIVDGDHILCTGRKKDLIIRAGENISAREIEDALIRMPRVADVAVVSMPSARTGEAICAFVVTHDGQPLGLPEIDAWIRLQGLARQKTPERVEVVRELPKTASGKVRKDVLRAITAQLAQADAPAP